MAKKLTLFFILFSILTSAHLFAQPGQDPGDNPNPELLVDEFFYEFQLNKPTHWLVEEGSSFIISDHRRHHVNTGNAVGISTYGKGAVGKLEQIIDLKREGKELVAGDEVEMLIHYAVDSTKMEHGAVRLNMAWLSEDGTDLTTEEESRILNNPDLWFSKMKIYGELRVRSIMPAGAVSFRFRLDVNKESSVRFDDFSVRKQSDPTAFFTVLPQDFRPFETQVGTPQKKSCIVQAYRIGGEENSIKIFPANKSLSVNMDKLPLGSSVSALDVTFSPNEPMVIPRGYAPAPNLSLRYETNTIRVPIKAYAADPDPAKQPQMTIAPASPLVIQADVNQKKEISLECEYKNMINSVNARIESKENKIKINNTLPFYYTTTNKGNGTGILKITFLSDEEGEFEGKITFSSDMMEPVYYTIHASSKKAVENWTEKFSVDNGVEPRFKEDPRWKNFHSFDKGYWQLSEDAVYENTTSPATPSVQLKKTGAFIAFDAVFVNGIEELKIETNEENAQGTVSLEISTDGGGSWKKIESSGLAAEESTKMHIFKPKTHQPTFFRIKRTDLKSQETPVLSINKVVLIPSKEEDRIITSLKDQIKIPEGAPLTFLEENFDASRHTRTLGVPGWQNILVNGDRLFWGWDQKNVIQAVEESCAKITFYNSPFPNSNNTIFTSALVSPLLSYSDVKSPLLSFRLRTEMPEPQDEFLVLVFPVKGNVLGDPLIIPYKEYLLPANFTPNFWHDYIFNFKDLEGLPEMDSFFVAFALASPAYGKETTSSYMVDDVSWGKSEVPEIIVGKKQIVFYEIQDKKETFAQAVVVSSSNATDRIVPLVIGEQSKKKFIVSPNSLPKEGGALAVSFKAEKAMQSAAILRLTSRGAKYVDIQLLATPSKMASAETGLLAPNSSQGLYFYRMNNIIYIETSESISINLYNMKGDRIFNKKDVNSSLQIPIGDRTEYYILEITYSNGEKFSSKI